MAYIARYYAYSEAWQASLASAALARLDDDGIRSAIEQAQNEEPEYLQASAELFMKHDLADAITAQEAERLD